MKNKYRLIPFLLIACLGISLFSTAKTVNRFPDPADAKAVITDYINAIGGMDAVKKVVSTKDTGSFSIQGMQLPMVQKAKTPNKMLQLVSMNGTTVAKTVFNGTKGYSEQMGNHIDLGDSDMADMKARTSVIPQADYLTGSAYKLSLQGIDKVGEADAYKVQITMPSGATATEYYDKTSHLLLKQVITKDISGQSVTITYSYDDYRKAGSILMPYKQNMQIDGGPVSQSIDITMSDVKVNEGVTDADFE